MRLGNWRTRSMLTGYKIVSTDDLVYAQQKLDAALAIATPKVVARPEPEARVERSGARTTCVSRPAKPARHPWHARTVCRPALS